MNITELDSYRLGDAVKFHNRLNPKLWGRDEHLLPEVQAKLMEIAADFQEFLGITDLDVEDITISGSNAAFSYTPHSDIDLHLVVRKPAEADEVYQELFNAKKYQYNDMHDIRIHGADVELYVQDAAETPVSLGEYSVKNGNWIQVPKKKRAQIDHGVVRHKYEDLVARIQEALKTDDAAHIAALLTKIKTMRQTGLDQHGEFGPENLAFKILRKQGYIQKLYAAQAAARDRELSLNERRKKKRRVRYGYGSYWAPGFNFGGSSEGSGDGGGGGGESIREVNTGMAQGSSIGDSGAQSTWDGVSPDTDEFLSEDNIESVVSKFFGKTVNFLNIKNPPKVVFHHETDWSKNSGSFGQYDPDENVLHLATSGRHTLDILRTMSHELTHCKQNETERLPDNAGETGSWWEDEANATAGRIMRYWADEHPEMFGDVSLEESSGYIPTAKQKNDPRFKTALTVDIRPGATGREANKMSLQTDAQGRPGLLIRDLKNALREFKETGRLAMSEDQDLLEIQMSPTNLRKLAAQTGARAGMEFEMIVPDVGMDDVEPEYEPDWDQDQRSRSFSDVRDFFHDGDYNSRRDADRLMEELGGEYEEWVQEQTDEAWNRDALEYITDYISLNDLFDRDEAMLTARDEIMDANPDLSQESEDFSQLLSARLDEMEREFAVRELEDQGRIYNDAFEAFAEEQRDEYDERSFLDDKYPYMQDIQSNFDISWPYYIDINADSEGGADIDRVADEFSSYMGKPVNASRQYHGGRREAGTYVVEPDGSLEGDNPGDEGLEFVSPPMPIDEMISDLNKVKAWAGDIGAYTNDSTGLHINISVPDYSLEKLDYVKLALLMGDEYVLELFGRSGNTYAKAATDKIRTALKKNPDLAPVMMDKMREHMEDLATKAIHSGTTDKYTSINTKSGYIEFRSPGGDWLDENFDKIENTLLRFTVALSAAIDPEAYRQEYLKKLYKLLASSQEKGGPDILQLFANYSAGELDKAALIRQVREKQLARDLDKGKTPPGQKFWWNVSRPGYFASIEVVASSQEEAIAKAIEPGNYPDWASARNTLQAKPLRPYQEPQAPNQTGNWGIWMQNANRFARAPGQIDNSVLRRFPSREAAEQWIAQTRSTNSALRTDIEVREIPVPGSTMDLAMQRAAAAQPQAPLGGQNFPRTPQTSDFQEPNASRGNLTPTGPGPWEIYRISNGESVRPLDHTNRYAAEQEARTALGLRAEAPELYGVRTRPGADAAQGGTVDIATDRVAPRTLTTPGQPQQQFTGEWKIVTPDGREIHRFGGIGNAQADANRVAIQWLQRNPRHMQAGVEVLPVMG